ncbi:hypothetical protein CCMSSC00406_0001119 [Pleurotus cornucopiae]|uniref:Uncharacterized protein n=1 Tax=Pleurotus cornucopiae TaxID=5321 RepID=A0ACB7IKM6_PLECO|nr:hypothetical protein CCMSSC00406_0001119 [Pleurotus cornucopiae]
MKLSTLLLGAGVCVSSTAAQYFSDGWSPGQSRQTVSTADTPAPTYTPAEPVAGEKPKGGLIEQILSSGPLSSIFQRAGINISERLDEALSRTSYWDDRIPLITDENYGDLIVNETLTAEEEAKRTWFLVVTVTSSKQDGVSKILDDIFDSAFNQSQIAGDIPHVRWGRIDYLNVTAITTRWAVWHAPLLVVLRDRGQELRFYRPHQLNLKAEAMLEFLKHDGWQATPPWSSAYAPGGSREYLMEYLAVVLTRIYNVTVLIPNWMLLLLSGGVASVLLKFLHRNPAPSVTSPRQPTEEGPKVAPTSNSTSQALPNSKRSGVKQRKGGKK